MKRGKLAYVIIVGVLLLLFVFLKIYQFNITGKVIEEQCISDWVCTKWVPENCIRGYQTRTCIDLNHCRNETPDERQKCENPKADLAFYLIISALSVIILIIIIQFIVSLIKENK